MNKKKKIVLLGGGYGGLLTAKKLANKFKNDSNVEITLIDKNPYHTMRTELHEVVAERVSEESIRIDLKKIFAGRKVNVVLDHIKNIDFDKKVLKSENKKYDYDYLVVGTGSRPTFFGIPGVEEYTKKLWEYDDAVNLKAHILHMFREAIKETDKEKRRKMLTFVVVGGGFTGIELVGELGEYKERLCKKFCIDKEEVKLYVVDAMPKILPILSDNLIKKAEKRLEKLEVEIITGAKITEVSKESVTLGDKGTIESNTIVWAAGVEGSELMGNVDVQQNGRKRIVTNDKLQSVDHENVYVVGDNIFYIVEGQERPVPQMVENAEHSAPLVANNIYADIKGKEKKSYKPTFHGCMVCIGGQYGVATVGFPGKMVGVTGFMAMFIKHFINLVYFLQVAGISKCCSYISHEIFHVKDNRSLIGGHLTKSYQKFWLVPLRIFIGHQWLQHGLNNPAGIATGEVVIGLLLITGLFTSLSAVTSIVMAIMLCISGGFSSEILWYVIGAVALMGGAGKSLGLDYYVLPSLKKTWNNIGFVKKNYLDID
ncbi:FAD-dependent oxidoreductase [Oceanirhabdus seepicola]|uniref:NADH:ubiquinone reductase (non-electrogenic) n=1 Tax=Oceanirhabdus seepicola TaxID=2828781 RepID=A0A9J6P7I1_9CLOT|nr:FAD-dependent oxidoreductase [Oceanirhabdus seepicola]MCM1991781.1 FAD-dependent oxidoreductase [Oceanirhabdus seepicola]